MLVYDTRTETLPVTIRQDATTGLPLLREQEAIMQIILAYLALPYSVTEYGCGKKASLIIDQLIGLHIPPYALARGMILEMDMSPAALKKTDYRKREHALVADNPLYKLGDISDPRLREMLDRNCPDVKLIDDDCVRAGPYYLRHAPQVQFVTARSHIYTIVLFWDDRNACAVERVIDPSLYRNEFFEVEKIRDLLHAPEGLLFEAPLLGHFRLDTNRLTNTQRAKIRNYIKNEKNIDGLSILEHAELIRNLTGAEKGTLGDPDSWTYANNIKVSENGRREDKDHFKKQEHDTGKGDAFTGARRRLLEARVNLTGESSAIMAELRDIVEASHVHQIVKVDAQWSARQLEPLADAAMIFAYYNSLCVLAGMVQSGNDILEHLQNLQALQPLRGIGVRLRRRIDWIGRVSKEEDGRIDARALTPGFVAATIETIQQMNTAGLTVFIDRVGNVHGLLLDETSRKTVNSGDKTPADFTRYSIGHCSHIDTVNDAGKFDGRLGVLAGIETTHVLKDMEYYFDVPAVDNNTSVYTHVSAFIGEEMTFTGQGVAMPGSAAVAGRAEPERIYEMRNGDGERFGDCLVAMLRQLKKCQSNGEIELVNDLAGTDDDALIGACSDPVEFYTPHTFERHIEQGPALDRADVPIVMVGTIMGIYQEDFFFKGFHAEAAALEMNRRLRELSYEKPFTGVRITVGILEGCGESESTENVYPALRWTLDGELNHAGATPVKDRRDPGVAAARMAREFFDWFERTLAPKSKKSKPGIRPVVSNVRMSPGTNRNVIPGSVSMTVALACDYDAREQIDELVREDLSQTLEGFAIGTLARQVAGGGEGVRLCRVEPVSYTNIYNEARLSIDLRSDEQAISDNFRRRIDNIIDDIKIEYNVDVGSELQQKLPPFNLEHSGQALLMERSYGGSHNPREVELLSDIVRGCILQIAVTREVLARDDLHNFSLFKCVESHIPEQWLKKMARFTSGALHDTCNIAAGARSAD